MTLQVSGVVGLVVTMTGIACLTLAHVYPCYETGPSCPMLGEEDEWHLLSHFCDSGLCVCLTPALEVPQRSCKLFPRLSPSQDSVGPWCMHHPWATVQLHCRGKSCTSVWNVLALRVWLLVMF